MSTDVFLTAGTIGVIAVVTWVIRGLPYMMFGGKKGIPEIALYLGAVLPAAIMIILVVYCLRNMELSVYPFGAAELISVLLVVAMQIWKKNPFLSIFLGTACYMVLIRTFFA